MIFKFKKSYLKIASAALTDVGVLFIAATFITKDIYALIYNSILAILFLFTAVNAEELQEKL